MLPTSPGEHVWLCSAQVEAENKRSETKLVGRPIHPMLLDRHPATQLPEPDKKDVEQNRARQRDAQGAVLSDADTT